jgi:putative ABC transport system permease protein
MRGFKADLIYALRSMRKTPAFTAVAILTLALGLGANTAIFSFVDAVLLKPLPYDEPERIVSVLEKPPGGGRNGISTMNFLDWKAQNRTLQQIAAMSGRTMNLSGTDRPDQLKAQTASASYFEILGTKAAQGRTFAPDEDQPGKNRVAVISHRTWQNRFGGDPHVLGRTIVLDEKPYTIIGVLPADSLYDRTWAEIWIPLTFEPWQMTRNFHWFGAIGKLKPGVSLADARADFDAIGARIAKDYPDSNKNWGVTIDRYIDRIVGDNLRRSLYVLLAAVAAVLLIGCANMANLLLARGAARAREVAIRSALGASRVRLVRQMLTESLLLSVCGAVGGLALGYALLRGIQGWMPPFMLPPQANVRLDWRVMLFLFAVSLLTSVIFGVGPALQISRRDSTETLKESGRSNSGGVGRHRLRNALIVAEVALAFVLLSGAGLLIRSFNRLMDVNPGFDSTNVLTMSLPMTMGKDTDPARVTNYVNEMLSAIQTVPGVRDVAGTSALPLQGWGFGMPFAVGGRPLPDRANRPACFFKIVTPAYFRALGMQLRKGRGLAEADVKGGLPVAVINEAMAKKHFKGEDPIGKQILVQEIITGKTALGPEIPWQIVGVVADEKVGSLDDTSIGMYVPFAQSPIVGMSLVVRGAVDPQQLVKGIQSHVWEVNKDQPLPDIKTLETIKSESVASNRLRTALLGVFAAIAVILAAVGIYGVISYSTEQRLHEMGIRAALGASAGNLIRLVVGQGMLLTAAGLIIGVAGAVALTRLMAALLFETSPTDLPTLFVVGGVLASVALVAAVVPARRGATVDPMIAVRYE